MSQYAFSGNTIINQSFPDTRTALNAAYAALASNSSGDNDPTSVAGGSLATVQHQWWYDSTNNKLMLRNDANNAWIEIATIDETSGNVLSITTQGLTIGATALTATGAEINKLTGATVSTTELNQLNDITRGSILYGNASGATARLAKGGAGTVLTSDGTDISWAAVGGGGVGNTEAWVNFKGDGVVTIRGDGDVSSITDNGTGIVTVNFDTTKASADYSVPAAGNVGNNSSLGAIASTCPFNFTTGSAQVVTGYQQVTAQKYDLRVVSMAIIL